MANTLFTIKTIERVKAHPRFDAKTMDGKKIARWVDNRFKEAVKDHDETNQWSFKRLHEGLKHCPWDRSMIVDLFDEVSLDWAINNPGVNFHNRACEPGL